MIQKVRTTVYLDRDLLQLARLEAVSRRIAVTGLVERGLKKELGVTTRKKELKLGKYKMGEYRFRRADAYE